jgi:hypothetical protein
MGMVIRIVRPARRATTRSHAPASALGRLVKDGCDDLTRSGTSPNVEE